MSAGKQIRRLRIDLSNRSSDVQEIPDAIIRQYIGGRGLGSYLLYWSVPATGNPTEAALRRLGIEK